MEHLHVYYRRIFDTCCKHVGTSLVAGVIRLVLIPLIDMLTFIKARHKLPEKSIYIEAFPHDTLARSQLRHVGY